MKISPDHLLDVVFNNGHPNEGNSTFFHAVTVMIQTHLQPLHWGKRDFGIVTAIIAAITAGIAGVTTDVIALTQIDIMAEAVNATISKSSEALQAQEVLDHHLYEAIHILWQIDLVTEELALLLTCLYWLVTPGLTKSS